MTHSTAPLVALGALMNYADARERQLARRMGEAALAGRGFVLWQFPADTEPHVMTGTRRPARIVDVFADRATCEEAMGRTIWATTEAARGRSLAEACKIHGFEIVEVPPADQVWIVQAQHWAVSGQPSFAFLTEAGANAKAAELVNALIAEAVEDGGETDLKPDANASTWADRLKALQGYIGAGFEDPEKEIDSDTFDGATNADVWTIRAPLAA